MGYHLRDYVLFCDKKGSCKHDESLVNWLWISQRGVILSGSDLIKWALKRSQEFEARDAILLVLTDQTTML